MLLRLCVGEEETGSAFAGDEISNLQLPRLTSPMFNSSLVHHRHYYQSNILDITHHSTPFLDYSNPSFIGRNTREQHSPAQLCLAVTTCRFSEGPSALPRQTRSVSSQNTSAMTSHCKETDWLAEVQVVWGRACGHSPWEALKMR